MEIRYEVLARNKFEYEINRDEFNRLMNAKKSAQDISLNELSLLKKLAAQENH